MNFNIKREIVQMKDKKRAVRVQAAIMCGVLLVTGTLFYTDQNTTVVAAEKTERDIKKTEKTINNTYPALLKSKGGSKDKIETTYAIMDSDSNLNKVIVAEKLANSENKKLLKDFSTLKNIENTSGEEKFSRNGDDIKWHSDGNRIEYRGEATEDLPIMVQVSYYLNGEKRAAKEIAGKSGNIKIRFDYRVLRKELVNGRYYMHPYTVASGLILDNTHFSDVKVINGKTADNGNNTVAFGIAFPCMNENLGVDSSKLNIPSSVEVSAYTDSFKIPGTYSIAFSENLADVNTDKSKSIDSQLAELKNGLNSLSDASKKLLNGTNDLSSGATKLNRAIGSLAHGMDKLSKGSASALSGTKELNNGLRALSNNSSKINGGIKQLESSIFKTATAQIRNELGNPHITLTPKTYTQVIKGISTAAVAAAETKLRNILKSKGVVNISLQNQILSVSYNHLMSQGKTEATQAEIAAAIEYAAGIAKKADYVKAAVTKNSNTAIQILKALGRTPTDEEVAVISTALELAGGNKANIDSKISEATEYVKDAGIFKNGEINASDNTKKLAAIAVGKETPKKLVDLKDNLDQVESLVSGILEYTNGVNMAATGSKRLVMGMTELNSGISEINKGSKRLYAGSERMISGITRLHTGMSRFDNEGISKFVSKLNDEQLSNLMKNIKGIKEASKKDVLVGGKLDSMSGESKIIFKTGEI